MRENEKNNRSGPIKASAKMKIEQIKPIGMPATRTGTIIPNASPSNRQRNHVCTCVYMYVASAVPALPFQPSNFPQPQTRGFLGGWAHPTA